MYKDNRWLIVFGVILLLVLILVGGSYLISKLVQQTTERVLAPVEQANQQLKDQISQILNPTPTIIPDPITIIHDIRTLARLETIQYTIEKVITAEIGQGELGFLFGDRLLFVAHGVVIAGVDFEKLTSQDLWLEDQVLYVRLPEPEVFIATLDNENSYVYDRETGILTHGNVNLETEARQAAETEILNSALDDGILNQARQNAENYLLRLLNSLGYWQVIFIDSISTPLD